MASDMHFASIWLYSFIQKPENQSEFFKVTPKSKFCNDFTWFYVVLYDICIDLVGLDALVWLVWLAGQPAGQFFQKQGRRRTG